MSKLIEGGCGQFVDFVFQLKISNKVSCLRDRWADLTAIEGIAESLSEIIVNRQSSIISIKWESI
jgi:hypothetical protein